MTESSGRVAIVTGSDSGIGKATAVALAEQGFDLGITSHTDRKGAEATAEEVRGHGRRAEVRQLELTRLPGAADVVDELADVLHSALLLAADLGIDLGDALEQKLAKDALKYPVEKAKGRNVKYDEL